MENKCLICQKTRSLKSLDGLNVYEKLNEIFNIQFNEYEANCQHHICKKCLCNLNCSYDFYHQVREAINRPNTIDTVLVKVEVKEEIVEATSLDDFSIFQPFDSPFSFQQNELSEDNEFDEKPNTKINTSTKRAYNKRPPELRKKNRGLRRAKEAITLTTKNIYQNEMSGIYTEQPETLQILEEDKLKNGCVSSRVLQLFSPTSWQTFQWNCDECPNKPNFKNIMELNEHLHKAHRKKYKNHCQDCNKSTLHFAAYLNHIIESHTSHNKFGCILCPQPEFRWNLKDLLIHYQRKHSKKKVFFCIYCGFHFICGAKLKEHLISKHKRPNDEGELFQCDFCGWKAKLRHTMKSHMVKHVSQPSFMCDQCTLTFASASYLSTHISQVHSKLRISCTKCGKLFKSERRLRCHDRTIHQESKQFICHICQKGFHAQYRLNSHLKVHKVREEIYQCTFCERRFKYSPGLKYHIRSAHTGERPFSCPIDGCSERFFDYSNARKHISGSHNSPLKPVRDGN